MGAYEAQAQNATNIAQNAANVMNQIETLQQQQGTVTSQQIANYQNAYSQYVSASAAATSAAAQSAYLRSQTAGQNLTNIASFRQFNPSATPEQAAAATGLPISQVNQIWTQTASAPTVSV